MSSPYVVLGKRPLDQWKVTELREELKRRKLTIKGLKEDLIKRLDEAVRAEWENSKGSIDNNLNEDNRPEVPSEEAMTASVVSGRGTDLVDTTSDIIDRNPEIKIDNYRGLMAESRVMEADLGEISSVGIEGEQVAEFTTVETTVVVNETVEPVTALSGSQLQSHGTNDEGDSTGGLDQDGVGSQNDYITPELSDPNVQLPKLKESSMTVCPPSELSLQDCVVQSEEMNSTALQNEDSNCSQPDHNVQPSKYQVSEVDFPDLESQVISDSVSTESVPIIEINEVKVDVITDNVKLEFNVDREMLHSPPSSFVPDGGEVHPIEEPLDQKVSIEVTHTSGAENVDNIKNIESVDMGPEKLSLDRSSGDDSMEEDVMESKQMDYQSDSFPTIDRVEKADLLNVEEDSIVDVVGGDIPVEANIAKAENYITATPLSVKRKYNGNEKEAIGNNDTSKRLSRWNVEGLKGSGSPNGTFETPRTPKESLRDSQISIRRLNRSDSLTDEVAKERLVPPSSKPPSNSLRIDRFLRPFTLKAVQELLGKTGTVTSFWMDHIKTHCYVSYSSVEEAVETRNAVYNLQWPPNGGRMLVVEFVEPEEVKTRVEAPPATVVTPSGGVGPNISHAQSTMQLQPSPRLQFPRKQPPPPSLPPPPLPNAQPVRERLHPTSEPLPREQLLPAKDQPNLPPPPPLPEKIDPPIITLDDLFWKTKATPRIYYLPLSDEQVSAKLKAQGKNVCRCGMQDALVKEEALQPLVDEGFVLFHGSSLVETVQSKLGYSIVC